MTHREFTQACYDNLTGIYKMAALGCLKPPGIKQKCELFVQELLQQDSDEGSRIGTKHVLGEDLYKELQKFKNK